MKMRATIAGLGLIGGSIGIALRRAGWNVSYVDPAVTLEAARAAGAADERIERAGEDDLLVVATPVDVALQVVAAARAKVVTTTCSVMRPFSGIPGVVAGHPFAGSEQSGLAAARGDLFAGRAWFVERDHPQVRAMIATTGAEPVVIDPAEHDAAVALTSHLPQVISTALAALVEEKKIDPRFIGSGLKSVLRLAGSSHSVWGPVLESNRENIGKALGQLVEKARTLSAEDFAKAQRFAR